MDREGEPVRVSRETLGVNNPKHPPQLEASVLRKTAPNCGAVAQNRQVRLKLLLLIDRASKVVTDSKLEERKNAGEKEVGIARQHRLLREYRRAARLDLETSYSHHRSTTALGLDLVQERVVRKRVGAIDKDLYISQDGDRISYTAVRSDSTKVLGKRHGGESDPAEIVPPHGALGGIGRRVEHIGVALKDRLIR